MRRLSFTEHPASVGENYLDHLHTATGFGWRMVVGGFACLIHGLVPFVFTRTGSTIVQGLHQRMVVARSGPPGPRRRQKSRGNSRAARA